MKKWRLFIESALQSIGMSIVVVLGITVLTGGQIYMGTRNAATSQILVDMPVKMMLVSIFIAAITSSSMYTSYVPVGMCLNCRRIDALLGMQIMKLLAAVLMAVVSILLFFAGGRGPVSGNTGPMLELVAVAFCAMIAVLSVGEVIGLMYLRFQKVGMIILIVFFAVGGGMLGTLIGANLNKGITLDLAFGDILLYAVITAIVLWVLDFIISWRLLAGLEVR